MHAETNWGSPPRGYAALPQTPLAARILETKLGELRAPPNNPSGARTHKMSLFFFDFILFFEKNNARGLWGSAQLPHSVCRYTLIMTNWTKDFLHETNINNVFQQLYDNSQVYRGDKSTFAQFMEYIANKNYNNNLNVGTANKYVTTRFDELWSQYNKNQKAPPVAAPRDEPVAQQEQMSMPSTLRRRNKEKYVPQNETTTTNPLRENPNFEYTADPPIASSVRRRPVPANYDQSINFSSVGNNNYSEDNNVYSGVKNISIGGIDDTDFSTSFANSAVSSRRDNEPSMRLATDSSDPNSAFDTNIAFASGPSKSLNRALQEFIVVVDSRLRDISISPNSNSYRMQLNQLLGRQFGYIRDIQSGLPNIVSIELLQVTIPNIIRDSTLRFAEPYLYLDIGEITGNIRTPVDALPRAFAQIYYVNSEVIRNTSHLTMVPANTLRSYPADNPLSKLNTITMKFHNFDGELFDFGTDAPRIIGTTTGVTTTFQTDIPHGMATSDRIYIRGFITNNQAYTNEITRPSGWIVAVNTLDTFEIQYDSTGMPAPGAFGYALIARLQNNVTLRIKAFTTDLS